MLVACLTGLLYSSPTWNSLTSRTPSLTTTVATQQLESTNLTSPIISYMTGTVSAATVMISGTTQSMVTTGISVRLMGYVYNTVESPACYPQCLAPSFLLTYLFVPPGTGCTGSLACFPPPEYYRLLNLNPDFWTTARNGTRVAVTGTLVTPSSWACNSFYVPKLCMTGDLYVQEISFT